MYIYKIFKIYIRINWKRYHIPYTTPHTYTYARCANSY